MSDTRATLLMLAVQWRIWYPRLLVACKPGTAELPEAPSARTDSVLLARLRSARSGLQAGNSADGPAVAALPSLGLVDPSPWRAQLLTRELGRPGPPAAPPQQAEVTAASHVPPASWRVSHTASEPQRRRSGGGRASPRQSPSPGIPDGQATPPGGRGVPARIQAFELLRLQQDQVRWQRAPRDTGQSSETMGELPSRITNGGGQQPGERSEPS